VCSTAPATNRPPSWSRSQTRCTATSRPGADRRRYDLRLALEQFPERMGDASPGRNDRSLLRSRPVIGGRFEDYRRWLNSVWRPA